LEVLDGAWQHVTAVLLITSIVAVRALVSRIGWPGWPSSQN
jgi:hypothetical protein